MTTGQPGYLHNRTAQALGLIGALLVAIGSTVNILADEPDWLDWLILVGGVAFLTYWVIMIVRGHATRRAQSGNGHGGQVDE